MTKLQKIKILYIVSRLANKGPTNQLYGIISNLDLDQYEPVILTLSKETEDSKINDFLSLNIQFYSLKLNNLTPSFILKRHIKKYIDEIDPQIIQTQGVRADSMISSMDYRDKHCLTLRNYAKVDYSAKFGNVLGKIMAYSTYKTIKNCEYVICCSESIKDLYNQDIDKKFYVIQNGVDVQKYNPISNSEEKLLIRQKLGINLNDIVFLVVGSMISRKDPLTIIEAFNKINVKNYKLLFLGDGPLLETAQNKANNDNIIFKGNVNNVTEYLRASDYYISASKSEGLPNSVLEASSCGLNLILSDIPQHKEIFEKLSYQPSFFGLEQSEEVYKIILNMEKTSESNSTNKSLSKEIEQFFSTKIMSKNYQKFYESIIFNR